MTRARELCDLHAAEAILVLPNAWDAQSARLIAGVGFPALATTSSGIAALHGIPDGQQIGRDRMLAAVAQIVQAVDVPVSADLEAGYGPRPEDVADTVQRAVELGAAGANLEDSDHAGSAPLVDIALAVERIRAGRAAADAEGVPFVINARTDSYLRRVDDPFAESVRRANAYLQAGARCAFVPGVEGGDEISRLVKAIDGPLNVLARPKTPPTKQLQALGVARVSVGGALARATSAFVERAAQALRDDGTYDF